MSADLDRPRRAAVLGSPIGHSLSPVLHEAAYRALGLTHWSYRRCAVGGAGEPTLPEFLGGLNDEWVGLSVTMPLKEEALALATSASSAAARVGGANTLLRTATGWAADSTDGVGVRRALQEAGVDRPRRAAVFGSGATARSVLDALAALGCRQVDLLVRGEARAPTLALAGHLGMTTTTYRFLDASWDRAAAAIAGAQVVVSTLPTGIRVPLPVAAAGSLGHVVAMDVVYADWPTPFARWAGAAGARVISGLDMLLFQAAEQVRLMTGQPAPLAAMRRALIG